MCVVARYIWATAPVMDRERREPIHQARPSKSASVISSRKRRNSIVEPKSPSEEKARAYSSDSRVRTLMGTGFVGLPVLQSNAGVSATDRKPKSRVRLAGGITFAL